MKEFIKSLLYEVLCQAHCVLKYRFYYYSGIVRLTYWRVVIEKIICYSQIPRGKENGGSNHAEQGHRGRTKIKRQKKEGKT